MVLGLCAKKLLALSASPLTNKFLKKFLISNSKRSKFNKNLVEVDIEVNLPQQIVFANLPSSLTKIFPIKFKI
jgi:hypothetical protein